MEGIETADALLSQLFPGGDYDLKVEKRKEKAKVTIARLKMDRLECLHEPLSPVSLMMDYSRKL